VGTGLMGIDPFGPVPIFPYALELKIYNSVVVYKFHSKLNFHRALASSIFANEALALLFF
jgi:hypothetical protein